MSGILILQLVLLLCGIQVVLCVMQLVPKNLTVLRGAEVRFNLSTNEVWEVMVWLINGRSLLTISVLHGPLGYHNNTFAVNHSTSAFSVWEIVLKNPTFIPMTQEVACELLPGNYRETATLSIQETGSVTIFGGNVSVLLGTHVELQCQAVGWYPEPAVAWSINHITVDRSKFNSSSIQEPSGLFNKTSRLYLTVEETTSLECWIYLSVLPEPHISHALISIAVPPENDSVVVIAVTVTIIITALLALVIVFFYCRHTRTKAKLIQDGAGFGQHVNGKNSVAEESEGRVNLGYHTEGFGQQQHGVTETTAGSTQKVPDIIYIISHEPKQKNVIDNHSIQKRGVPKKIRQTTTV